MLCVIIILCDAVDYVTGKEVLCLKILVVSDSHGRASLFDEVLCKEKEGLDFLFFLGDGEDDFFEVRERYLFLRVAAVRGNCDMFSSLNISDTITVGGKKIFYSHGHAFGVKGSEDGIIARARSVSADAVLYGHTHSPVVKTEDSLFIMNPGALKDGRYGVITIENGEIRGSLKRI